MDPSLRSVSTHMLELGKASLAHANYLANFYSWENGMWSELAVLQAAHACEIFLKARLAQEHPLLIFETIPKSTASCINSNGLLDFEALLQKGQTIMFSELPDKVWAATGKKIENVQIYRDFGFLRNSIQHFAAPMHDVTLQTQKFIYEVIDPFINEHWSMCAVDYCDDSEGYEYLIPVLASSNILFCIPDSISDLEELENSLGDNYTDSYKRQILQRGFAKGLS